MRTMCLLLVSLLQIAFAGHASAQTTEHRSEWGPDDERGAANRITPATVLAAIQLVRTGKVYELGRAYEAGMPIFPGRHFSLSIPGSPTGGPLGKNQLIFNDEMVSAHIGQVGTQFDGLGHIGSRINGVDVYFNGHDLSQPGSATGLGKLGIENVGAIVTRGVLIDIAAYKGVQRLPTGQVITADDLQEALKQQSVEISAGDVVLIHTGHGNLWMTDNEEYNRGAPGIGIEAALWLASKKIVMTGADTWPVEVYPAEDPEQAFPVHQELIARRGIYNFENLDLSELASDQVYEFMFMFSPLKLKGATGSPGNPIAIR